MNTDVVDEWLGVLEEDLIAAANCAHGRPPAPKRAAFFIQQAAEKLKAVLVAWDIRPPHTHDIAKLTELILKTHPRRAGLLELHRFTRYAVVFRYPLEEPAAEPIPEPAAIASWITEIEVLKADLERWSAERKARP
jgi:HEPN domain-containing protein